LVCGNKKFKYVIIKSLQVYQQCQQASKIHRDAPIVVEVVNPLTPTVAMLGTAIKHPVPDRVKLSFVMSDAHAAQG